MRRLGLAIGFAAGLAAVASFPVKAEQDMSAFYSGNNLFSLCGGSGADLGRCYGYIEGVTDMLSSYPGIATYFGICLPYKFSTQQVHDIGVRFLGRYPESRHFTATSLMINALKEAFPCSK